MNPHEQVGEGTYSLVRMNAALGIAIKEFRRSYDWNALQEIAILQYLNHKNIIKLTNIKIDSANRWVLYMKLCSFDLSADWRRLVAIPSFDFIERVIIDVSNAIDYMHRSKVIHGDLKPANLLYDKSSNRTIVCDFNIAIYNPKPPLSTLIQTPCYRAPEVNTARASAMFGYKIDIWSFGCIVYELLTKERFMLLNSNNSVLCAAHAYGFSGYNDIVVIIKLLKSMTVNHCRDRICARVKNTDWARINGVDAGKSLSFINSIIGILQQCLIPDSGVRIASTRLFKDICDIKYSNPGCVSRKPCEDILLPLSMNKMSVDTIDDLLTDICDYTNIEFNEILQWENGVHEEISFELSNWIKLLEYNYYKARQCKKKVGSGDALIITNACIRIISFISRSVKLKSLYHSNSDAQLINISAANVLKTLEFNVIV